MPPDVIGEAIDPPPQVAQGPRLPFRPAEEDALPGLQGGEVDLLLFFFLLLLLLLLLLLQLLLLLRRRLCQFPLLASPPRRGRGGSRGARSGSRSGARSVLAGEVEQGPEAAGVQVAADPRRLVGGEGPGQVGPGLGLGPLPLLLRRVGASRLGGLVSCLGIGRRRQLRFRPKLRPLLLLGTSVLGGGGGGSGSASRAVVAVAQGLPGAPAGLHLPLGAPAGLLLLLFLLLRLRLGLRLGLLPLLLQAAEEGVTVGPGRTGGIPGVRGAWLGHVRSAWGVGGGGGGYGCVDTLRSGEGRLRSDAAGTKVCFVIILFWEL